MASHQIFSRQVKYLFGQIKFGHTNLRYVINMEFIKEIHMSGQFSVLIISTVQSLKNTSSKHNYKHAQIQRYLTPSTMFLRQYYFIIFNAGFCPHWSAVVQSDQHHSITTSIIFIIIYYPLYS